MIVPAATGPVMADRATLGAAAEAGAHASHGQGGERRVGGEAHTAASQASIGAAGSLPKLGAGQMLEAMIVRPASTWTSTGVSSMAIRIIAFAPAVDLGTRTSPDGVLATLVAVGADGRPVIAIGDALLRLNAATDLEPGARFVVELDAKPRGQAAENAGMQSGAGDGRPLAAAIANPLGVLGALCSAVWQAWQAGGRAHEASPPIGRPTTGRGASSSETATETGNRLDVEGVMEPLPAPIVGPASLRLLRDQDHEDPHGGSDGVRSKGFVLAIRLSELGLVEVDARLDPAAKRCDITVRSEVPLPATAHADLRTLLVAAGEVVGLSGRLGFARLGNHPPTASQQRSAGGDAE